MMSLNRHESKPDFAIQEKSIDQKNDTSHDLKIFQIWIKQVSSTVDVQGPFK
jgi:hypothetical protein